MQNPVIKIDTDKVNTLNVNLYSEGVPIFLQ